MKKILILLCCISLCACNTYLKSCYVSDTVPRLKICIDKTSDSTATFTIDAMPGAVGQEIDGRKFVMKKVK